MKPEVYFIKYSYPCSHILHYVRGEITKQEFEEMENAAINNKSMDKKFLEKVFFRAFERIEKVAKEIGKDKWDLETIREYFKARHNSILDKSDYPDSFKEMCKVLVAKVVKKTEDGEIIVAYGNNKTRKVKKDYLPNLKIGDKVIIHWQYAIEKV